MLAPNTQDIERIIQSALLEDIGTGDITSAAIIPESAEMEFHFIAREPMVVAGIELIGRVFQSLDEGIDYLPQIEDGTHVQAWAVLATISGPTRAILTGERVALNLLQHMCGVATLTAQYVQQVKDTTVRILDTRKTMPGLRVLDKYAVTCGGGHNHRMRLDDGVLIKDNHIAQVGSVREAVMLAREKAPMGMLIEVECDTLAQVGEALEAGADRVLLDNMDNDQLREAVALCKGKASTEASGNVTLETIADIAATGVDFISIGRLTHSIRNVDIGLDAQP